MLSHVLCLYVQGSRVEIQTPAHWNLIGRSVTAPQPVIAQRYSSAIFVTLRFLSVREEFGAFKNVII
jgi:hypothetical protein